MTGESNPAELVGRVADQRLLTDGGRNLPQTLTAPEPLPASGARGALVATGATLTGVSLVGGSALLLYAVIAGLASGFGALQLVALVLGVILVATHWGWVHIAEITANRLDGRHERAELTLQERWLEAIEPYTRYEVSTSVRNDGSIEIVTTRLQPIVTDATHFTFVREPVAEEVHSAEEPSAEVAERAELLRRDAAAETQREQGRFALALDAYESALLGRDDEQRQIAARRAASEALSEQINSNLRNPPLAE
jgi:hypothetical protein